MSKPNETAKTVRITLVKSPIGYAQNQRATVRSLGLRKLNASVTHKVTPQIQGMINTVSHLVKVEEVEE
jgi:large subunit ribosomal protein L30